MQFPAGLPSGGVFMTPAQPYPQPQPQPFYQQPQQQPYGFNPYAAQAAAAEADRFRRMEDHTRQLNAPAPPDSSRHSNGQDALLLEPHQHGADLFRVGSGGAMHPHVDDRCVWSYAMVSSRGAQ